VFLRYKHQLFNAVREIVVVYSENRTIREEPGEKSIVIDYWILQGPDDAV
jgi:hypothetical protein